MRYRAKSFLYIFSFLIGSLTPILRMHSDNAALISEVIKVSNGINFDIDYISPFGPIPYILLSLTNYIFHNVWVSYLFISGIQNLIFSYLIFSLSIKYTGDIKAGIMAGVITAIWFTPQVGGFYFDNITILFGVLSFNLISTSDGLSDRKYNYFLSGLAMAFCFLIKQNTFLVNFIPILTIIILFKKEKLWEYLIYFIISTVLLLTIYDLFYGNAINFIIIYLESIISYQSSTQRLSIFNIIMGLIYPYNINLKNIFNHKGILIFIVLLIFYYYYSIFIIRDIILKKVNYIVLFFAISNILVILLVGRGISNTQYFIGILFIYLWIFYVCMCVGSYTHVDTDTIRISFQYT